MSTTLQRLGITTLTFSKDQQDEAIQQIQSLRQETMIIGEGETFDWSNMMVKPDLIEIKSIKGDSGQIKMTDVEEEEWNYSHTSLFIFTRHSTFRNSCIRLLESSQMEHLLRLVTLLNIVAFCCYDYSTRMHGHPAINRYSISAEVLCNVFFGVEAVLSIVALGLVFEPKTYLRSVWNIVNAATFFASWSVLGDEHDGFVYFLRIVRLLRAIRLIQEIPPLKTQMDAFVGSFPRLGPILIPLLFVMLYYSIVGLHLFMGLTEYRCRLTPEPEDDVWEADGEFKHLCGIWKCPHELTCGSPADHGIPRDLEESNFMEFSFNFIRFDDFFHAFLVVFTLLLLKGWSGTTFLFWKSITTYVTAFYFLTLIIILALVLSDLLLATFYESFMVRSTIKTQTDKAKQEQALIEMEIQKKRQQQMMGRLAELNEKKTNIKKSQAQFKVSLQFTAPPLSPQDKFAHQVQQLSKLSNKLSKSRYFVVFNTLVILLDTFTLAYDHHGIPKRTTRILQSIEFGCSIYFLVELAIKQWGRRKSQLKLINKLDAMVILVEPALYIYLFASNQPIVYNDDPNIELVKSLQIVRLIKLLYQSKLFYTISILTRCLIETLIKIREMISLWLFLVLVIALYGQEFLAYRAFFEKNHHGELELAHHGEPPELHFDDFGNSLLGSFSIFYNEEWHISMYQYGVATKLSLVYYVITIVLGRVLFSRLLTAVFLNQFCRQLKLIEQQVKPIEVTKSLKQCYAGVVHFFQSKRRTRQKVHSVAMVQSDTPLSIHASANKNVLMQRIRQSIFSKSLVPDTPPSQDVGISQILSNKSGLDNMIRFNTTKKPQQQQESPSVSPHKSPLQPASPKEEIAEQKEHSSDSENESESRQSGQGGTYSRDRTLFLFPPDSEFRKVVTRLVSNEYFRAVNFVVIIITSIRIALLTPVTDPASDLAFGLRVAYIFTTLYYILLILLNCIAFGLYRHQDSYFRQSFYNIFTFLITLIELITLIFSVKTVVTNFITSLRILQFLQIGAVYSTDISYAQKSLLNALTKMAQLSIFCFLVFVVYGVFAMKLLKGAFYHCSGLDEYMIEEFVKTKLDCMDYGGSWVNATLTFDSINEGVFFLFVISTTEGWLPLVARTWNTVGEDHQPHENYNRWWAAYFYLFFFIGNLCMLNMFIGLVVSAYNEAKERAQHLHLLDDTQKEWFHIKHSIFKLKPLVKSKKPSNLVRQFCFYMVKNKRLKIVWLVVIFVNTLILSVYHHRQDESQKQQLDIINSLCIAIFTYEIVCRFIAKDLKMYLKDTPNVIDIIGIWVCLINLADLSFRRTFNAISVGIQLTRNYKIIKRFNDLEKLFSSIFSVIPSALSMVFIMFIFLFIFTSLGMDMYAFLRPQETIDGWDLHFRKFTTAMFSLIRVASSEEWWQLLVDSAHTQQPDFACVYMNDYDDFVQYGYNGCGTPSAYLFYITFHLIISLVILNLFIASIIDTYEEHVKSEESAISKYQLNDVLSLWLNYDPEGHGFINYKDFWKLSSQIAIIFGVDQADLLDVNNKRNFLKVLNIPIYENKISNVLCYRFHDVILSLTKISVTLKYGVTNLEPTDKEVIAKFAHHNAHHDHQKGEFNPTSFRSGDMVAIIMIQKKFRIWKRRAIDKDKFVMNEFGDIKNLIKRQIEVEEEEERQKLNGK